MVIPLSRFRTYTDAGGTVNADPTALSAIVRPLGGGATIEDLGDILANKIATGLYYATVTDASYTNGQNYEVYSTATVSGSTVYGITEFQFRAVGDTTAPAAPATLAWTSSTATTAACSVTVPTAADYNHCSAHLTAVGAGTQSTVSPLTITDGAFTLESLSADTTYALHLHAYDGADDDTANRSEPSNHITFRTAPSATVTPAGPISLPLSGVEALIAATAAWQSWTGTADATAAAARIHRPGVAPEDYDSDDYPYCLIYHGDDGGYSTEDDLAWMDKGTVAAVFVDRVPAAYLGDDGEPVAPTALDWFTNKTGDVLSDAKALEGEGYIVVEGFDWEPPARTTRQASHGQGIRMLQALIVRYGP